MITTLSIVLPIFALILAGYIARRVGTLGPHSTKELNRFVVYLALPAKLFDIVAHAKPSEIWQPGFVLAFGLGSILVFALTVVLRLRRPRHLADAAIDALNAGYANVGFVGFPLAVLALGKDALAPTLIATIITVCVLFAIAIVLIEVGLQSEKRGKNLLLKVSTSLCTNPLLVAPCLGALVMLIGVSVPAPVDSFLDLLGGAASPCALVALGLFLGEKQDSSGKSSTAATATLVIFKLLFQPVVTWLLATAVFGLSPSLTRAAVLLAALPTGTGPFMLAEFYKREAFVTSRVIMLSTVVSVVTLSGYLSLIHH